MNTIMKPCTRAEARGLTDRIRENVDHLWALMLEAYDRRAWKALGYDTWAAYVTDEFQMKVRNSYLLIDQGRTIRAIEEAAGENVQHATQITQRAAQDIKDVLPAVTKEIRSRVEAGEDPKRAAADAVAQKRAEKAAAKAERNAQQAEWDRQQEEARRGLNPALQRGEAAKHANGARNAVIAGKVVDEHPEAIKAHRDELLDEVVALRADVVERDRRLAAFDAMVVQFEQGGFETVIATKDERIQGLLRQVEDISADRAALAKSRDFWRKQAIDLGYVSPNSQIEIGHPQPDTALIDEAGF